MPVADGTYTARDLWVGLSGVNRRVRKVWAGLGGVNRLVYQAAVLSNVSASRDACTTNSGHVVTWSVAGEYTGWTVTIERDVGLGYVTLDTGLSPTLGTKSYAYGGGNSQTGTTFRVSLVSPGLVSFGSPATFGPTISLC